MQALGNLPTDTSTLFYNFCHVCNLSRKFWKLAAIIQLVLVPYSLGDHNHLQSSEHQNRWSQPTAICPYSGQRIFWPFSNVQCLPMWNSLRETNFTVVASVTICQPRAKHALTGYMNNSELNTLLPDLPKYMEMASWGLSWKCTGRQAVWGYNSNTLLDHEQWLGVRTKQDA